MIYLDRFSREMLTGEQVAERLREHLGERLLSLELREHASGLEEVVGYRDLWLEVDRRDFPDLVQYLFTSDFLHFHVLSGDDEGEWIRLIYHFSLFLAYHRSSRVGLSVSVRLPKEDLVMPSLQDRIPGAEYSEREMREMLGVEFAGMPDRGNIFLPEDWDDDVKPWRRDSTGPGPDRVRELG